MIFADRADAGRQLVARLGHLRNAPVVVLGLARGGVPVAYEIARALAVPLDVIVVRKLGVPFQPELGMGAIGEDGVRVVNDEVVRAAEVSFEEFAAVEARERAELQRRTQLLHADRKRVALSGCTALIVDDGVATGSTAIAACRVARAGGAERVVVAVPVAPEGWERQVGQDADELVCLMMPKPFAAIGQFYEDFSQTTDAQVLACLEAAAHDHLLPAAQTQTDDDPPWPDRDVEVPAGEVHLDGRLVVPGRALGVVAFAHGSGSSRHSPRNRFLAAVLNASGLATLLFDLLTPNEELDRANVFDVALLARRLLAASAWLRGQLTCGKLPLGYFGASTGAAAALWAAAEPDCEVATVVCRSGRLDLAGPRLGEVRAPTLLIVGGEDDLVLGLNERARERLVAENRLVVVPGATHLFEEPGTLQRAAVAARDWFTSRLAPHPIR
ncbi:MAG: phosphoribosyltransferase family protein [Actinomycetota bacterium]|nr:phosphoribosyltransferase family protein [Actinomycetota bacterium]